MATINEMNPITGQITVKDTSEVIVTPIQGLTMLTSLPTQFDHIIREPAANGMVKLGAVSHAALIADAIAAVDAARSDLVSNFSTQLANKLDKPSGTTSQYVRGDGTLATLPAGTDVSGKSDKSQFAALSTLAAHGRSNAATNSPTDSKTDYNVVTTLLGSLTDGLNQTNTKQNAIAANLNTLATQFNALLTWLTTNQSAINNLRAAGAV